MVRQDGVPENQHYVPKMLLRNFCFGKKGKEKLYVFDKLQQKILPGATSIKNVASERSFYEYELQENIIASWEHGLTVVEDKTKLAFEALLLNQNLKALSAEELSWIHIFMAVQYLRGKQIREQIGDLDRILKQRIVEWGGDPNNIKGYMPFADDNEIKRFSIEFLRKHIPDFSSHLARKQILLFETSPDLPFIISDSPVTLANHNDFGPRGNLGLDVRGIQIHMPVSPTLMIALWCPSILDEMAEGVKKAERIKKNAGIARVLMPGVDQAEASAAIQAAEVVIHYNKELEDALDSGKAIMCRPENVEFFNSLQVSRSVRFIMSRRRDFELAERMLRENPEIVRGWAYEVA